MNNLITKFKEILLKDMEKEGDSNDLSVLIRILSILCIIHYFLLIFPIAYTGNIFISLFLIFDIGIILGAIICTYENKTLSAAWLFNTIILGSSILLSVFVGLNYFFIPLAFSTTFLVFYSARIHLVQKLIYSVFCGIMVLSVSIANNFLPLHSTPPLHTRIALSSISISLCFFIYTTIAYAFYLKYTKSEEKILQYNKRLEQLVNSDALTTLWNRRAMNEHLSVLVNNHNKYKTDFSLAIMDIDYFKKVNDEYGHGMGDFVLKSLSYLLKTYMEGKGHVARWGGEEFLLTFENMDYDQAIQFLEQLRLRIEVQEFTFKDVQLHLTISAGVEEYHSVKGLDQVLTLADEKLYIGKTSGRNKIVSNYDI